MTMTMLYSWTFVSVTMFKRLLNIVTDVTMFKRLLNIVTDTNSHGFIQIKNNIKHKNSVFKYML